MAVKKRRNEEPWQARLGTAALDPLQVMDLQDALRAEQTVAILNGREFELSYQPDGKTVFYKPTKGLVPCGYLDIKKILRGGV